MHIQKNKTKKRILALFSAFVILAVNILAVIPTYAVECSHPNATTTYDSNNDGTHLVVLYCADCDWISDYTANCNVMGDGSCNICGYNPNSYPTPDECAHPNGFEGNIADTNTTHKVYFRCSDCGINEYRRTENCEFRNGVCVGCTNTNCSHSVTHTTYTSLTNAKHSVNIVCSNCSKVISRGEEEFHTFNVGVCTKCNATEDTITFITGILGIGDDTYSYFTRDNYAGVYYGKTVNQSGILTVRGVSAITTGVGEYIVKVFSYYTDELLCVYSSIDNAEMFNIADMYSSHISYLSGQNFPLNDHNTDNAEFTANIDLRDFRGKTVSIEIHYRSQTSTSTYLGGAVWYVTVPQDVDCEHSVTEKVVTSHNNGTHTINLKCTSCGEPQIVNEQVKCDFENSKCTVCEYVCLHPQDKYDVLYASLENGRHDCYQYCKVCDFMVSSENLECTYGDNGDCVNCGYNPTNPPTEEPTEPPADEPTEEPTEPPADEPTPPIVADRSIFYGCSVNVNYWLGDDKIYKLTLDSDMVPFDDFGCLDMSRIVSGFVTEDIVINAMRVVVTIKLSTKVTLSSVDIFATKHIDTTTVVCYAVGLNDVTYPFIIKRDNYSLHFGDIDDNITIKELNFSFSSEAVYNSEYNFKLYTDYDAKLTDIFTGIYDGMFNVFYKILNFDILGFNVASFLMGIITVCIGIIIVKLVLVCIG